MAGKPVKETKRPCPCAKAKITSKTFATAPANRARTKLGVGEEVKLTFSLGKADWTASKGKLSPKKGAGVTFTAPDRAASVTIKAVGSGCTAAITFTVVEPSSVNMRRRPGTGVKHTNNRPDSGMQTEIYIFPDNVCFYNMEFLEDEINAVDTGVYALMTDKGHHPNTNFLGCSMTVVSGLGTKANAFDTCYSGYPAAAPPYAPGSRVFNIPWKFRVGSGTAKKFAAARQQHTLAADGTTLSTSKAGASAACRVNDPTSGF